MSNPAIRAAGMPILILTLLGLSACQSKQGYQPVPEPKTISAGSLLVQKRALRVGPGVSTAYFQAGRLVDATEIRADAPYCRLELAAAPGGDGVLEPRTSTVRDLRYEEEEKGHAGRQQSVTILALSSAGGGGERMSCLWPDPSSRMDFVTPEQISDILGELFSIEEPD